LRLKPGVSMKGMSPQVSLGAQIVEGIYLKYNGGELRITSITEGKHMRGSKHFTGCAFDAGVPAAAVLQIVEECREALGEEWDVIDESKNTKGGPHIHFEWDPKS